MDIGIEISTQSQLQTFIGNFVIESANIWDCKHLQVTLEKAMATHSSTLAWRIPWTEEPGRLQSMVLQTAGHDWATSLSLSSVSIRIYILSSLEDNVWAYLLYSLTTLLLKIHSQRELNRSWLLQTERSSVSTTVWVSTSSPS